MTNVWAVDLFMFSYNKHSSDLAIKYVIQFYILIITTKPLLLWLEIVS